MRSIPLRARPQNATVRENILFGNEFDKARYDQVVKVCGLEKDLALMDNGDLTQAGQ